MPAAVFHRKKTRITAVKADRRAGRITALTDAVSGVGAMHLRDAAALLGVSEMTVRRDIAVVPGRFGYLGGYIVPRSPDGPYVMAQEQGVHAAAKAAVASRAAALIENDDTIFLDCGTTMPHLVRMLPADLRVTVVCYALNIAGPLASLPHVRLILLGGVFNPASASFAVDDGLATLERVGINKAFLSAGGVHAGLGVTCSNFHEVAVKQAVMRRAAHRCLVVDGSKLGKLRPAFFAELSAFDTLVTNPGPQAEAIRPQFRGTFLTA